MIIDEKIIVKNYKCFDETGGGFDRIYPINVIIGKNNSGKSSLIDLVNFLTQPVIEFNAIGRDNTKSEVMVSHKLTEDEVAVGFQRNTSGGGIPGINHFEYGKKFINHFCTYLLTHNKKTFQKIEATFIDEAREYFIKIARNLVNPLKGLSFCHLAAERDITQEAGNTHQLAANGKNATSLIQVIINEVNRDSHLIETKLLEELNKIVQPDIEFSRILVQLLNGNTWEIYFEDVNNKRIALSKMGSGIKTILLVLLNLIIRPEIDNKSKDTYVFAFEELENNLHPALQRRLYEYIKNYSEKYSAYFFITTHSNIVIDTFGTYDKAQMIHVTNDGEKSKTSTILSAKSTKEVLKDLDIRASDLLQSNGIIWVEGPSDRIYVNKWLQIFSPELTEGLHYSIMFYGGRLLSNLSFDFDWLDKEIIPLLKINTNAFIIIDRDGKITSPKLNATKLRINEEIGDDSCWITKGREIENYLSNETISKWLHKKLNTTYTINNDKNEKIETNIKNANSRIKLKYNLNKRFHSSEIANFIDENTMNVLDLEVKLGLLIQNIKNWNLM